MNAPILHCLLPAAIALLVGCSSTPQIELPEPKDVPREKWSDAMQVLDAMGIVGQRDVPRELAAAGPTTVLANGGGSTAADAGMAAASFAAPPTGFSGGAALGLSVGLMLLGGGASPVGTYQTAAWVPSDQAASPQEASALVLRLINEARAKALPRALPQADLAVGMHPVGSGRSFANPSAIFAGTPVQLEASAAPGPAFTRSPAVYGPIFLYNEPYSLDAVKNDVTTLQAMTRMSAALPEWFYLYHPGQKLRKNSVPARILNQGQSLYFIGK